MVNSQVQLFEMFIEILKKIKMRQLKIEDAINQLELVKKGFEKQ